MEYTRHNETIKYLQGIAQKRDTVLCAFSGGKDSLVCLDLCCRTFKNVTPFFMYFIPGLECCEIMLKYAEERWGVKALQYPHWLLTRVIKNGIYCKPTKKDIDGLPEYTTHDIYKIVMQDTGVRCLVTGAKDSDSMWRRRYFTITKMPELVFPVKAWNKFDIISYLKRREIPIPQSSGAAAGGVDLSTGSLLFLHKNYPRDFARIREFFPFIDAVIYREKWYGKEKTKKLSI